MSEDRQAFVDALLGRSEPHSRADRIEIAMGRGQAAAIQGAVVILASIVVYCAAAFRGGLEFDPGEIVRGASPLAAASLMGLGAGTLLWIAGCVAYLRAAMEAESGLPR